MHKLKYLVPNAFTAASLLLGLASITRSAAGDFELAAWMVLWGVLLDKLDGTSARLLGASSRIGAELDSFADFVVFGIAPAALLFFRLAQQDVAALASPWVVGGSAGAYVVATATRLARFNITSPPMGERIFYGVPTTLCGAILASSFLAWTKYDFAPEGLRYAPFALLALGALMVSTLKLPKLKKRKSLAMNVFQFSNVGAAYVLGPLRLMPEYLLGLALTYTVGGVLWCLVFPPQPEPAADDLSERRAPVAG